MNKEEIQNGVFETIEIIKGDVGRRRVDDFAEPLTGSRYNMSERDLVYLLLELTKKFKVQFEKEDIMAYRMQSINGVTEVLQKKLL